MASVRFHLDEHVPHAVAEALRRHEIDVRTAGELGLLGASDPEHLAHARAAGRVLVTHDGHFLRLHAQGHPHAGIAYCLRGTRTIGQIAGSLMLIHEVLREADMVGHSVIDRLFPMALAENDAL